MTTPPASNDDPHWLDEFEDLANRELPDGSACEQVHPIVEEWFHQLMAQEPPTSRPSVEQATACLTTEVINTFPDDVYEALLEQFDEDEVAAWVEQILRIGRAFEASLRDGKLDDL
jgi:hypothetical protein